MELIDVDIVGLQIPQAGLQVRPEALRRGGRRFGGEIERVPTVREGVADLLLAVGIEPGGVEEGDARIQRHAEKPGGLLPGDALDGQRPEAVFVDGDAGPAQRYHIHRNDLRSLLLYPILAMPCSLASSATALATASATDLSRTEGMM